VIVDTIRDVSRPPDPAASQFPASYSASYVSAQRARAEEVTGGETRHFIVCGDTTLAFRLVEELSTRYRADVTVIMADPMSGHGPRIARMNRVNVVQAAQPDGIAFRAARINSAAAVALAGRNDVDNVYAALQAQDICAGVRLVLRIHNSTLGRRVEALFENAQVLSDVEIGAPAFVGASLGAVEGTIVRIGSKIAHVTTRADLDGHQVLCGLAATIGLDQPILLPVDESLADLVLAMHTDAHEDPAPPVPHHRIRRLVGNVRRTFFGENALPLVSRSIVVALALLSSIVVLGIGLFWFADRSVSPWEATYLMLFTSVGAGNTDLSLSGWAQVIQTVVTLAGVAMIPIVSAAIVQASVHARLALPSGALAAPDRDHVIVVGLGGLGTRVIAELHDRGVEVVAVDHIENPFGAALVRDRKIHFIVGDASRRSTLDRANVGSAAALVVLTADDVVNLEYALRGREERDNLRVVLRLFDGDFADRIKRVFNITTSRSVSFLAAPAFAAGMVGREVIGTIGVRRRVLLVADVPVIEGSWLADRPASETYEPGEARVIALIPNGEVEGVLPPFTDRMLTVGDRLIVVATRVGLSHILGRSAETV
jgi:Trk K+ transport system NAD-binding subunit